MSLSIVLRTVCGCERIIDIPGLDYPPVWRVPYHRGPGGCVTWGACSEAPCLETINVRTFERLGSRGTYGYYVYLEKIETPTPAKPATPTLDKLRKLYADFFRGYPEPAEFKARLDYVQLGRTVFARAKSELYDYKEGRIVPVDIWEGFNYRQMKLRLSPDTSQPGVEAIHFVFKGE